MQTMTKYLHVAMQETLQEVLEDRLHEAKTAHADEPGATHLWRIAFVSHSSL